MVQQLPQVVHQARVLPGEQLAATLGERELQHPAHAGRHQHAFGRGLGYPLLQPLRGQRAVHRLGAGA